jgi:hypothetical protein
MESRKAQKIPLLRNTLISSMHASKLIYGWKRSTRMEKKQKNDVNNEWWTKRGTAMKFIMDKKVEVLLLSTKF